MPAPVFQSLFRPAGALYETCPEDIAGDDLAALTSAQLYLVGIGIPANTVVTAITFWSGSTALDTGANQWFALFDRNRVKLAVTSDDTSGAWAENTAKTLNLASPYPVNTDGLFYLGVMVKGTTPPTLTGKSLTLTSVPASAPIRCGTADGTLTDPASCPATASAITATGKIPYAYIS